LITALLATTPGKTVQIRWRDSIGSAHSGTIRPIAGPPQ
jgi:hypothetical protein